MSFTCKAVVVEFLQPMQNSESFCILVYHCSVLDRLFWQMQWGRALHCLVLHCVYNLGCPYTTSSQTCKTHILEICLPYSPIQLSWFACICPCLICESIRSAYDPDILCSGDACLWSCLPSVLLLFIAYSVALHLFCWCSFLFVILAIQTWLITGMFFISLYMSRLSIFRYWFDAFSIDDACFICHLLICYYYCCVSCLYFQNILSVHHWVFGDWSHRNCSAVIDDALTYLLVLIISHPVFVTLTLCEWWLWLKSPLSKTVPWVNGPPILLLYHYSRCYKNRVIISVSIIILIGFCLSFY